MTDQPSFIRSTIKKIIIGLVFGAALLGAAWKLEFPDVFIMMFAAYVLVGTAVFILLDAPPMKPLSGFTAVAGLLAFYLVLSAAYIISASSWPQYDPEDEKGKIEKLLKAKRERAMEDEHSVEDALKQAAELEEKADVLLARLNRIAPAPTPQFERSKKSGAMTLLERGMEVYELHECYNCHKVGGKGSVKKRGPVLDNIGNLLTIEDIKKKIFDPTYLYAEGFEKEHKKGQMPDKYKELMTEEELGALAAYLSTLKNPAAETPKPVFVKTKVEHGFIVYGYVRDAAGKPVSGVEVKAVPQKKDGHAGSTKTNPEGYYEIFLHLHNEDNGTKVIVSAGNAQKEVTATYDPSDKVTKRQAAVDLKVS